MKKISFDAGRCSGCRLCEMLCSFKKEGAFASSTSRITVKKVDSLGLDLPIVCWHCDPCKAMENCAQEALQRNKEGLVFVREERCVGCGNCIEACILGAIKLHPVKDTPQVCDQCEGKPVCVQKCPTRALMYIETEEQQPKMLDQVISETLRRWGIIV